jgi:hypothetical protein
MKFARQNRSDTVKRLFIVATLLSAICFCFLVIIWLASYHLNLSRGISSDKPMPGDSIFIIANYRLGFEDGSAWFYNHDAPYRGSIIALVSTNDPPPVAWFWRVGNYGFGHSTSFTKLGEISERSADFPGIYFRHIWHQGHNPPYATLMVSLWYPTILSAILPLLWFFSRRNRSLPNRK